jgi:transposase-like protein
MTEETTSDRVQSVYTSLIKNMIGQLHDRYTDDDYSSSDVMFDCALVMIKEAAQVAVLLGVPKDTYLATCVEVYDVVQLAMTDVVGTA